MRYDPVQVMVAIQCIVVGIARLSAQWSYLTTPLLALAIHFCSCTRIVVAVFTAATSCFLKKCGAFPQVFHQVRHVGFSLPFLAWGNRWGTPL